MKVNIISILALAPSSMAQDWCHISLTSSHTQGVGNPDGTNTATYSFYAEMTYADGNTERLDLDTAPSLHDYCIASALQYQVCVTSNHNLKDGYMNYAADHADFNSDRCEGYHDVNPFSAFDSVKCRFKC